MKTIRFWSVLPVALVMGCQDSGQSDVDAKTGENAAVQARERASAKVDTQQLNEQLTAKITFGTLTEVQDLLKQGATAAAKNRYGLPVIFMAAQRGDRDVLEALIAAGANVNSQIGTTYNDDGIGYSGTSDGTPLGYAAAVGKVEAMAVLLHAGADVNGQGPEGTTALMRGAENGQVEAVRWLLENGATQGRPKALALAQRVINPNIRYQAIIRMLSPEKR